MQVWIRGNDSTFSCAVCIGDYILVCAHDVASGSLGPSAHAQRVLLFVFTCGGVSLGSMRLVCRASHIPQRRGHIIITRSFLRTAQSVGTYACMCNLMLGSTSSSLSPCGGLYEDAHISQGSVLCVSYGYTKRQYSEVQFSHTCATSGAADAQSLGSSRSSIIRTHREACPSWVQHKAMPATQVHLPQGAASHSFPLHPRRALSARMSRQI